MLFGSLFRLGVCRCGSASDALPLSAEPVQPPPGGDPALGPAFGPLPGPEASWTSFRAGPITVVYTLDAVTHPFHALPPDRAAPPAGPTDVAIGGLALGQVSDPAHPAHVQAVALMAAYSAEIYRKLGFKVPATATIRLCTHGGEAGANYRGGTEVWLDHLWVSTRLDGPDALLTVAHELFHRVQYLYNPTTAKTSPLYAALREGGARLAEDWVLNSGDRYLKDGAELLGDPGRPLLFHHAPGGEIAPHSYAAALFWRWMCEQHGKVPRDITGGHEVMRAILEGMIDETGYILQDLREARSLVVGQGHLDRFEHLDVKGGETLSTETDWGNFLVANWMHGTAKPVVDLRFDYVEDDADGGRFAKKRPFVWPNETIHAERLTTKPYVFEIPAGAVRAGFAARYTIIDLAGAPPPLLQVDFAVDQGMEDPLVQLLLIRRDGSGQEFLQDLIRIDARHWTRFVPTAGLAQVIVIVAAREKPGRYRLAIAAASDKPVLHVTPWNAAPGTSFETDPRAADWPWASPDLALDGNDIRLRATNRGDAPTPPLPVAFAAQGTTPDVPLRAAQWRPLGDATLPPIPPGGTAEIRIPWQAPGIPVAAKGWGLRATISGADHGRDIVVLSSVGAVNRPKRIDAVL
ncbi:hypothetical protein KPL78_14320 [Roseomonas sp. HJA6]|uniref:Uncharacterized protein n=1 Tax=Roseomonas alba TaxID=2846776 RepID=A0ABS7A9S3_9PROT|nr:hypothetical protein [Neoroseomonas alba]MBW6399037.1 hypothetical protein [Neoroseomonas alba]